MRCEHCGRETPEGHYCAYCGAHLAAANTRYHPQQRRHAFAANPSESVYHPSVVTTLFPHLAPERSHQLRWILGGAALIVFLIAFGRLVPVAIVLAALLVPLLYLYYFYEVAIFEDEPLAVLAGTFLAGLVLGAAFSAALYKPILDQSTASLLPGRGPTQTYIVLTGVVFPMASLLLMLVGPVVLLITRRKFDEVLDGLAFGAASGLGFATAQSIVFSWLLITGPLQRPGQAFSWALPVVRIALLQPLLYASAAGLVCASLWLARDPQTPRRSMGLLATPLVAVLLALILLVAPALASVLFGGDVLNLVYYAAALVLLLLLVRVVLHVGLVEKAQAIGHGGTMRCPHCFHEVGDTPFCPHCGLAMRSTSNRARPGTPPASAPSSSPQASGGAAQ
ncbi:MAG TPA: PrsW family glutamic-type intramembrane protease [Ktedonobacterales bacterium]|nr:PrsW family glutamic-type intramembrane protease [Ktedonobacterales bacterium]